MNSFSTVQKTRFFLNNQPDALIIPILFCYKTLYVSDGTAVPPWLCLEAVIKNLHETYPCGMYSRKLLMMGREDARNMQSFITE